MGIWTTYGERGVATLVDSSVWIDFFNGRRSDQAEILAGALGQREIVVGDVMLAEVLQGFRREKDYREARRALLRFRVVEMVGKDMALRSAANFRRLRAQGITIRRTLDCLIATYCIESQIDLLHADRDFDPFERVLGLRVLRGC